MRKRLFLLCSLLATGTAATAQSSINWFPQVASAADINSYLVLTQGASLTVEASDACLAGDMWMQVGVGLPGPEIQTSVTNGTAEGCLCAQHAGGYDASFTLAAPNLAIVVQRMVQPGIGSFPASAEMRMTTPAPLLTARQFRGIDACGVR